MGYGLQMDESDSDDESSSEAAKSGRGGAVAGKAASGCGVSAECRGERRRWWKRAG